MPESIPSRAQDATVSLSRPDLAFPRLTADMLRRLQPFGREELCPADTMLFSRGQRDIDMFVILEGRIEVYAPGEDASHIAVAILGPQQFTGELDLLSSRRNLVDARTTVDSRLLRIARSALQSLMRTEGDITNLIMQATIWRRVGIVEHPSAGVLLVGEANSAETIQLRRFLVRNGYPHRIAEPNIQTLIDQDNKMNACASTGLPAIVLGDGRVLQRPTIAELADELGITEVLDESLVYDVIVVGAGPSGLAAAVYAASEGLRTLVIDGTAPGGQAGTSSKIENYLGFPTGISGQELASRAQVQAQKFGAHLAISRDVIGLSSSGGIHTLTLEGAGKVRGRAVIVASGARYRKLDIPNYSRFEHQGIHYAATAMEASLCMGREVAVVGGGNSAGQAAIFLSEGASHVHLLIRSATLKSSMSDYLIQRVAHSPKITLHTDSEVAELNGQYGLEGMILRDRLNGGQKTYPVSNMFVMIGAAPNTEWLGESVMLDNKGFVLTGVEARAGQSSRYATNVPGVFAVGDVRYDSVKRVASAVGEGSVVISDVHRFFAQSRAI